MEERGEPQGATALLVETKDAGQGQAIGGGVLAVGASVVVPTIDGRDEPLQEAKHSGGAASITVAAAPGVGAAGAGKALGGGGEERAACQAVVWEDSDPPGEGTAIGGDEAVVESLGQGARLREGVVRQDDGELVSGEG